MFELPIRLTLLSCKCSCHGSVAKISKIDIDLWFLVFGTRSETQSTIFLKFLSCCIFLKKNVCGETVGEIWRVVVEFYQIGLPVVVVYDLVNGPPVVLLRLASPREHADSSCGARRCHLVLCTKHDTSHVQVSTVRPSFPVPVPRSDQQDLLRTWCRTVICISSIKLRFDLLGFRVSFWFGLELSY